MYKISASTIVANLGTLVDAIDLKALKRPLVENGVYSEYFLAEQIGDDSQHPTTQKQRLLFGLKQKNPEGLSNFVQSLIDAKQYEAVKILIPGFEKPPQAIQEESSHPLQTAGNVPLSQPSYTGGPAPYARKISALKEDPEDDTWDVGSEVTAYSLPEITEVKVKQAVQRYAGSYEKSCYRMESSPRGYALLFVNEIFNGRPDMQRHGASKDKDLLEKLFTQLGYEVLVFENMPKYAMNNTLQSFVDRPQLKSMDSFVLVCSSHGEDDAIICTDMQEIYVKDIKHIFDNENCPSLSGKPKLFIMQACRGGKMDEGVPNGDYKDGTPFSRPPTYKPTVTDMLIAFSTTPGYAANRTGKGSWYIYLLTDVFMKRAWNTRLADMLMEVNRRMSQFKTGDGDKQAAETVWQGWHKQFYFNPGL